MALAWAAHWLAYRAVAVRLYRHKDTRQQGPLALPAVAVVSLEYPARPVVDYSDPYAINHPTLTVSNDLHG